MSRTCMYNMHVQFYIKHGHDYMYYIEISSMKTYKVIRLRLNKNDLNIIIDSIDREMCKLSSYNLFKKVFGIDLNNVDYKYKNYIRTKLSDIIFKISFSNGSIEFNVPELNNMHILSYKRNKYIRIIKVRDNNGVISYNSYTDINLYTQ